MKTLKKEAIERVKNEQIITYYGILNGKVICQTTAMFDKNIIQNSDGLVGIKTIYLCNFSTVKKHQGNGHFSKLFQFMINDLKNRGYEKVTLDVEPSETKNLKIYQHLGFNEFIKSGQEIFTDGKVADVEYYGMSLIER